MNIMKSIGEYTENFWNKMDIARVLLLMINIYYEFADSKSANHN